MNPMQSPNTGVGRKLSSHPLNTKTANEWAKESGYEIIDPDGWRGVYERPLEDKITLREYNLRIALSTVRMTEEAREYAREMFAIND